ncbi:hypothetical protein SAMN04487890_111134 [Mucilaginibacter polytrichastri]|nr:hypothetical protein SAMN04487890_111134 [Mucilaginibacter polytrichastri]
MWTLILSTLSPRNLNDIFVTILKSCIETGKKLVVPIIEEMRQHKMRENIIKQQIILEYFIKILK